VREQGRLQRLHLRGLHASGHQALLQLRVGRRNRCAIAVQDEGHEEPGFEQELQSPVAIVRIEREREDLGNGA